MKKTLVAILLLLSIVPNLALAKEIEGVNVPDQKTVEGKSLVLNGAGVRTSKLVVVPIKAYVAAFYAPQPLRTEKDVMASKGPLQFDFTFLREVGQGDVTRAWNAQFEASVSDPYEGLAKDQAAFVKMFGPLRSGGVETVVITGDQTKVFDDGTLKGSIQGTDFQKAFLSMWFGANPVMSSLKTELLGN